MIEVLLAIVILGLASVAILLAFGTSISGSAEHRNLATADTVLRTAAEVTTSLIQQQSQTEWGNCPTVANPNPYVNLQSTVSAKLPAGWSVQIAAPTYWNTASSAFLAALPSGCVQSTATSPQINSPQEITITVTSPTNVVSAPLSFVVDDPLDRPLPTTLPASQLVLYVSPAGTSTTAGAPLGTQPVVQLKDPNGNTVTNTLPSNLILSINPVGSTPAGASLTGCVGTPHADGVYFSGCAVTQAGTYTLTATDSALTSPTVTSLSFTITAASAAQLAFTSASPGPGTAGIAIPNVGVQVEDAYGNVVPTATGSVSISIPSGNGSPQTSFNSGTTTIALTNGVATFPSLVVHAAGTYTFAAAPLNISGVTTGVSSAVTVNPGAAASFAVTNTGSQTAGTSFTETITAIDAFNNVATGYSYNGLLSFSGPSNSPSGALPSYPTSVTFGSGVATVPVTLVDAQSTPLYVAQGSINDNTSAPTITVGFATVSAFKVANPGTQTVNVAFSDTLTATDRYGNTITTYGGAKTLSFSGPSSSPGSPPTPPSYPTSATSVTFTSGVGTATGIKLFDSQSTTLTASQTTGSVTVSGTSTAFTVSPSTASRLAFSPATPGSGSVAAPIPNVAVQVLDPYGNVATATGGFVTMTIAAGSTQTSFAAGSTNTATLSGGVATFSNLLINTAGNYTLTATPSSGTGLTASVSSGSFNVGKVTPTSDVVTNATPTTLGSSVVFTATVAGPSGGPVPTGTVSWTVSGTAGITACTTSTTTLSGTGTATCSITVSNAGTYVVSDSYGGGTNYLTTSSATPDTVSVGFTPNLLQVESKSGGVAGKLQGGDHIGVTFPVAITATSVCPGETATGSFPITGTVTIANGAAPNGDDELTFAPASGQCTGNVTGFASGLTGAHAGYIDLGSPGFVTANATIAGSTLTFDPTTNNIQLVLGGTISTTGTLGTVTTSTATYYPDSAILSSTGSVAVSGSVSAAARTFMILQPTASAIASGVTSPNGTPGSGDTVLFTFSQQMDPNSILPGWNGAPINEIACFGRAASGSTLFGVATTSACTTTLVNLGTVSLGDSGPYYVTNNLVTLTATMAMTTVGGQSVVTVTFSSNGTFTPVTSPTVWTWTPPTTGAADLAGNSLSTAVSPVSGSKENFGPAQPAVSSVAEFRGRPSFFRLLEQILQTAWVIS